MSLLVGRDFDAALAAQSDDTRFVTQVVRAVRASSAAQRAASRPPPRSRTSRLLMYGMAAALLTSSLVVGAASPALRRTLAFFIGGQGLAASASGPATSASSVRLASNAAKRASLPQQPTPPALIVPAPPTPEAEHAPPPRAERGSALESAATRDGRSAQDLFAQANAERRAGDVSAATKLYQELQRRYPRSREAEVSRVSVGRLLLEGSRDPKSALEQFDRALRAPSSDRAGLGEEALFGRASALMRLGHRDDERSAWQQLIQQYPGSIYADRAHARLAELGPAGQAGAVGVYPAQQ